MAAYLGLQAINGRSKFSQTPLNVARHNLREIAAELHGRDGARIDPTRCKYNQILRGPGTAKDIVDLMERRILDYGAVCKRIDQIKMFEVVVSLREPVHDINQFFSETADWLTNWFDCPLLSAVIHNDEQEPHCHYLFVPLRDGRLQGSVVMGSKGDLHRLQVQYQEQLGQRYGLKQRERIGAAQRQYIGQRILQAINPSRLTADQQFQLRQALNNAGNFTMLSSAFGIGPGARV